MDVPENDKRAPDPSPGDVYFIADLCRKFRASAPTIRKAIREGIIPAPIRLGAKIVFPRGPIDALLNGAPIQTAGRTPAVLTAALR